MPNFYNSGSVNFAGGTEQSMPSVATGAAAQSLSLTALTGAGTLIRGRFFEFQFGITAVPAATDASIQWQVRRITAAATGGTAVVSSSNDPADTTRSATVGMQPVQNCSAGGTVAATGSALLEIPGNQRATLQWIVDPGSTGCIITPATTANGLAIGGFQASAAYTGTYACSCRYQE